MNQKTTSNHRPSININKVFLAGTVGNINIRQTKLNKEMCTISLATRSYQGENSGAEKFLTTWHNIVIYSNYFVEQAKKVKAGDIILVWGELRNNEWKDAAGASQRTTQVVIGDYKGEFRVIDRKKENDPSSGESMDNLGADLEEFFSGEAEF